MRVLSQIYFLSLLFSCQKLSNSAENDLLTCGESLQANKVFYQIEESPDQVRAYQVSDQGALESIPITAKGCVIAEKNRQTIIRSIDSKRSHVLDPKEGRSPGTILLTEHGIRSWQLACPTQQRVTRTLAPDSFLSVKSPRNEAIISIRVNDQERKTTRFDEPLFPPNADDRIYRVKLSLIDKLTDQSLEIECEVELDTTPPLVSLNWQGFEQIETEGMRLGKITRYSPQSFQIDDADNQARVEYCSLPYSITATSPKECPTDQILTAARGEEIAVSSRQGIWQILYRGVDSVGNRQREWEAALPILIEDRTALDQMNLATERFRFIGEWKSEYLDSLISTLAKGLAQYRSLGTDYERQMAENYLLPYLLKANTTHIIPNRKVSLLEIVKPHLSDSTDQSIIEAVEGPGQELVMAIQDGAKQRVLMVDPHSKWVHPRRFEFTNISPYTTAMRMHQSIFAFHFRDRLQVAYFSNGKNYSIENISGIMESPDQNFIYFIKDGRYQLIDFPSHDILNLPALNFALTAIYRAQNSFFLIGEKAEVQKCSLDFSECLAYGTLSQNLSVRPSKFYLSAELGHLFMDGEQCYVYDIANDKLQDLVRWTCKIELFISRKNKTVSLYFQDFGVGKWADYIPAMMDIYRHEFPLDIVNAEYGEIGFHSDRYIASRRPQGEFSPLQQQYLFDTYLKRNVFPVNGRKIVSGDQKWLFRPDRYTFDMDMYYIGEDPINEVELEQYTEFKHVAKLHDRIYLLEDYTYDHERTLLLDYDGNMLVDRNSDMFNAILSAAKSQRKVFKIEIKNDVIEIDGHGNLLTAPSPSDYRFIRRNYPILSFGFKTEDYVFDQETGKLYPTTSLLFDTHGHYFKTNVGIQAANGSSVQGKSLGPLGKSTETYLDHLIKIDDTDLILAIGMHYIKVLDANTLNDLVTIPPRILSYWSWFTYDQGQSRNFFIQEVGKTFADELVNIPYRKRAIWNLDFTMEAQIRAFCQNLSNWRYPGIDTDTMERSCPKDIAAP